MSHELDPRLALLYEMTPPCRLAADIGTDHGYLICTLVETNRALRGLAADLNPLPLEKARREAQTRGLTKKISFCLTNGLTGIPADGLDVILIAGMGGETISHILESWPERETPGITWLLQPMTKPERLRQYLWDSGFVISREKCCTAAGRVYSVLEARFTGETASHPQWERHLGAIDPRESPHALRYAQAKAAQLEKIAAGLNTSPDPQSRQRAAALAEAAAVIRGKIPPVTPSRLP